MSAWRSTTPAHGDEEAAPGMVSTARIKGVAGSQHGEAGSWAAAAAALMATSIEGRWESYGTWPRQIAETNVPVNAQGSRSKLPKRTWSASLVTFPPTTPKPPITTLAAIRRLPCRGFASCRPSESLMSVFATDRQSAGGGSGWNR